MRRRRSAAVSTDVGDQLAGHLLRADGQEDLCFATYHPSHGRERITGVIDEVILPREGERHVHGTASFEMDYFLRAAEVAAGRQAGLAFLHSHPNGLGWQGMSGPDRRTERRFAPRAMAVTNRPLLGLTLAGDATLAARFWETGHRDRHNYERVDCESVRKVGEHLEVAWNDELIPVPTTTPRQLRTISAWSEPTQADIARLKVGVVGAGSVGALVAEALARTGIRRIALLDFDRVEKHNLDRLLHATDLDARLARSKVEVLRRALELAATAATPQIEALELSVVEDEGFRAALDCDLLFSCVDRPWPRAALNLIGLAHHVPVVDVGIGIRQMPNGKMRSARWHAQTVGPGRRCLECSGQFNSGDVPVERDGSLDDPAYIEALPAGHRLRVRQNVFPFSMAAASLGVEQALRLIVKPGGLSNIGAQRHEFKPGTTELERDLCSANCLYAAAVGTGDASFRRFKPTGRHQAAERARGDREQDQRRLKIRIRRSIDDAVLWVRDRL